MFGYALTGAGSGYTLPPIATVASPNVQATATVTVSGGGLDTFTITAAGGGYVSTPTVTITGGGATSSTKYVVNTTTSVQLEWTGSEWINSYEGTFNAGFWRIFL